MISNANLHKAKDAKNDEFYTQLIDIENELRHYKNHFKGKVVYCNCDDPYESNFFKYFVINFNRLGLKKLICTCYAGSPAVYTQLSLFGDEEVIGEEPSDKKPYKIEITHVDDLNGDGAVDLTDVELLLRSVDSKPTLLEGDGDFRSQECIELLKQADIVVTNPPFSLFREYVAVLMEHEKKFLIIGNKNAITYKEFFPLLKEDKVWIGNMNVHEFIQPDGNIKKFGNIGWYTNLDILKRHESIILWKKYTPEEYPKYDNYDAINVNKVDQIPCDYGGVMGVPITFLDKYNPEQFEIVDLAASHGKVPIGIENEAGCINGKWVYARILIRRKDG